MSDPSPSPTPRRLDVARLVASGFSAPHANSDPPIAVRYDALPAWLAARGLLAPDWQAAAARAAASVAAVAGDLPDGCGCDAPASSTSSWSYARCLAARDALIAGGHTSRTLLGGLSGPAGTVDAAVRTYERTGSGAAAAALALASLLDCELPALRAAIARAHQAGADLGRRAADSRRAAVAAAAAHAERCARVGVPGVEGVGVELARLPGLELPGLLRGVAGGLCTAGVGEAMAYYAAFSGALQLGTAPSAATMLPALAALRAADLACDGGSFWGGAGAAAAAASPPAPPPPPTPSPGAGDADTTAAADSWGITTVGGGEAVGSEAAAAAGGGGGGGRGTTPPTTPPSYQARRAHDPSARAALGDDLAELAAFLQQRIAETGSSTADASAAAAGAPPPVSVARLDEWVHHLASASSALASPRARLLFGLRAGGSGGGGTTTTTARVLADLESGARVEARHRAAAAQADARRGQVQAGMEADKAALGRALARARAAVAEAEAGAAARLGKGRTVVLVGVEGL